MTVGELPANYGQTRIRSAFDDRDGSLNAEFHESVRAFRAPAVAWLSRCRLPFLVPMPMPLVFVLALMLVLPPLLHSWIMNC